MLELAIVGAGIMGTNHARIASSHPRVHLAAICDPDVRKAAVLGDAFGAPAVSSIDELPRSIEAAVVATPTGIHHAIASELIDRGLHLLVEKPLALTADLAEDIVDRAATAGVTLAVGHVERFNPAILQLPRLLDDVLHVEAMRVSPFSPRVSEGVVLDLMLHDLDVLMSLLGSEVSEVHAVGRQVRSTTEDLASVLLRFESGVTAHVTASRIGQNKIRRLEITQQQSFVTVDLVRQDIQINRVSHEEFVSGEGARYRQQGIVEIPFIEARGEPLFLELDDFVGAIEQQRPTRVTGGDGLRAVRLCLRVGEALQRN